jgi:glycerol dehydrogenase-like iron-containing ADH family enzyme
MEAIIGLIGALILMAIIVRGYLGESEDKVEEVLVVAHLRDRDGETIERKKHKLTPEEYEKYLRDDS